MNQTPDPGDAAVHERIVEVAREAAARAGQILCRHAGEPLNVDEAHRHDIKLEVDRLCEDAIRHTIHATFPDHAILAEEGGASGEATGYRWIIDPLDGTVNFFYGLPYYCTSVACYRQTDAPAARGVAALGEPVVGVVHAPTTGETFVARHSGGADLNGRRVEIRDVGALPESIVCLGFGKTTLAGEKMVDSLRSLAGEVRKVRCLGAAAYDICNVAAGRVTGFYERGLRTWDVAAAIIVLRESGGALSAEEYEPGSWQILASAPGVHDALRERLWREPE